MKRVVRREFRFTEIVGGVDDCENKDCREVDCQDGVENSSPERDDHLDATVRIGRYSPTPCRIAAYKKRKMKLLTSS